MMFVKNIDLAVIGDDGDFWLCRAKENVKDTAETFSIQWYEKQGGEYALCGTAQSVSMKSVIGSVELVKGSKPKHFELSPTSEKTVTSAVKSFFAKNPTKQMKQNKGKPFLHKKYYFSHGVLEAFNFS